MEKITLFQGFTDPSVTGFEQGAMIAVIVVSLLGLLYAWFLTRQIMSKPLGTIRCRRSPRPSGTAAMLTSNGSSRPYCS